MNYAMIEAIAWLVVLVVAIFMAVDLTLRVNKSHIKKRLKKNDMTKGEIIILFVVLPLAFGAVVFAPLLTANFRSFFDSIVFIVSLIIVVTICFWASSNKAY